MRVFTCIICPNGCEMTCPDGDASVVLGALCGKGKEYVRQELTDPRRTISSVALVDGGERPLVGVRITGPIPRDRIGEAMAAIRALRLEAPVGIGDVLAKNFLGTGCDLIAVDDNEKGGRNGERHPRLPQHS